MKNTLFPIFLAVLLTGCVRPEVVTTKDSYHCHKIVQLMHTGPQMYQDVGRNKLPLATTQARILKEYDDYNCERYEW